MLYRAGTKNLRTVIRERKNLMTINESNHKGKEALMIKERSVALLTLPLAHLI
jgi:hypothetical protein